MKKILLIFIAFSLLVAFTSCTGTTGNDSHVEAEPNQAVFITGDNMVHIAGGTFLMGRHLIPPEFNPYYHSQLAISGGPMRNVTLSPFYIALRPVSRNEFNDMMGVPRCASGFGNRPAGEVTWFAAVEFANRLSLREGLTPVYTTNGTEVSWDRNANGYRLPTEAEWEFAVRAGTNTPFPRDGSHPWRLEVMPAGSVFEWCWDWHAIYPDEAQVDPVGPDSGTHRVLRNDDGGNATCMPRGELATLRSMGIPSDQSPSIGFRLARSATL